MKLLKEGLQINTIGFEPKDGKGTFHFGPACMRIIFGLLEPLSEMGSLTFSTSAFSVAQ
jgi:hypothetical protein